ncbi:MAG: anaerobic nitric oxide reductase flavorubredoxin [Deltaproteobacteria bacterium]|nr:anaerobic nitric oxide reductase flavorubredoxin [Deltaproteobacteria bacterium]
MKDVKVKNNVSMLAKIDWELRHFHGEELSTHKGSSYNAFLIQEEKTVLIDTVWKPFAKEFVDALSRKVDLSKIDFIVANHSEVDHSGSFPELMRHIPDTPIYCTASCERFMRAQYHQNWNFKTVRTGDKLPVGNGKELVFIEASMLHWPDTMFTYLTGDNILFSSDAFGQHFASEMVWADKVDYNVMITEAIKYYANIVGPFGPFVIKKIQELQALNVPVDIICPDHGVLWRENPLQIVETYAKWANQYKENRIAILYSTMWNGTHIMAENIAKGIQEADPTVDVQIINLAHNDKNDVITEVFRSKGILLGSATANNNMLGEAAAMLCEIKALKFRGKKAAAFGSYGWSGEAPKLLSEGLKDAGFEVVADPLRASWQPDEAACAQCREFGANFAKAFA